MFALILCVILSFYLYFWFYFVLKFNFSPFCFFNLTYNHPEPKKNMSKIAGKVFRSKLYPSIDTTGCVKHSGLVSQALFLSKQKTGSHFLKMLSAAPVLGMGSELWSVDAVLRLLGVFHDFLYGEEPYMAPVTSV